MSTTSYTSSDSSLSSNCVYHVYDGVQCVADVDALGTPIRTYTYGPGIDNLIAMTVHSSTTNQTFYAITDPLGTVHALVDETGTVMERYTYDAWGNVQGSGANQHTVDNRFLFQGREYSFATGLYNFRARWYDPQTGRWLSNDPIGISGGLNLYAFCGNNPVMYRDPWGWCVEDKPDFFDEMAEALNTPLENASHNLINHFWDLHDYLFGPPEYNYSDPIIRADDSQPFVDRESLIDLALYMASMRLGKPDPRLGYKEPKNWNGEKVRNPNGPGAGYPAKNGKVWVPTDHKDSHAPHYDVQDPKTGGRKTIYP